MSGAEVIERRPVAASPGAARRLGRPRRVGRSMIPYALLAPALIVYALFSVYPIYRQCDISFYNWHIFPGESNPFVGFSNYAQIFRDPVIRTAALNTLLFLVVTVPIQMAIGLFSAAMLTDKLRGSALWRIVVYVPVVTSWVVVSYVFAYVFNASRGGLMNSLLSVFEGHPVQIDWLAHTWTGNAVIWLLSIWKGFGWSFIIFLAALDGVPRELVESARVDGASEPRVWRYVIIPSLRPAITFVTVLLVIGATTVFAQVYLLTLGGPFNSTQVLFSWAYQQAFTNFAFGYGAAIASLLAVVLFGFSFVEIKLLRQQEA
ncbi:MAG TPA: sugar ABC transporter permease [Solirubrobacteraceae bacterium]|nr:sugar ABC transporter permease [Solirubrobacteraceae bacterium]